MNGLRALALSAIVTAAACPVVIRRLNRRGQLDEPNHRSSHSVPTPRGGGIACAAGVAATAVASSAAGHSVAWPAILGAAALATVGYLDDVHSLSPAPRLAAQVAVGIAVGATARGTAAGAVAGALLMPAVVNATNFMDGINGISGATAAVWGANCIAVGSRGLQPELVGLGAVTAGAGLGFLPFNLPSARIFLGDVGSYLLGGLFAGGILTASDSRAALLAASPLAVYAADTSTTLALRAMRGASLTEAHREHVYQRLVANVGLSHGTSTAVAVAVAAVVAAAGWMPLPLAPRTALQSVALGAYVSAPYALATGHIATAALSEHRQTKCQGVAA